MTNSSAESSRHGSVHSTTELYRSCMILAEEARSLLVENEGMKRLGLNAQVLASQTGEQGGALEVIVAEIGRLSMAIREVLGELGGSARVLSASSISLLHLCHLHSSYARGRIIGIDPAGGDVYDTPLRTVGDNRMSRLVELDLRLCGVGGLVADLSRITQQIPPVTTMIRIVITEIKLRTAELMGTVEDLKNFHAHLDAKVERMSQIRALGARLINELRRENA